MYIMLLVITVNLKFKLLKCLQIYMQRQRCLCLCVQIETQTRSIRQFLFGDCRNEIGYTKPLGRTSDPLELSPSSSRLDSMNA